MMTSDLAWMAGILDLRGRVLNKNNALRRSRQLVLCVDTGVPQVIRKLSQMTGTMPEVRDVKLFTEFNRRGCAEHCPEPHVHVLGGEGMMHPVGRWTVTGAAMDVVLTNLVPYLMVDRGYPEVIHQIRATVPLTGQGSAAVLASVRRLFALGWNLPEIYAEALQPYALTAT